MNIKIVTAIIVIAGLISCNRRSSNDLDEHDHLHNETLQLMAYNDDFELYAESSPFVIRQENDILSHFSFLKDFKPLTQGVVTVSLTVGSEVIHQTLDQPLQAGIYLFQLTPMTAGSGEMIFDIETPLGRSTIVVPDIEVFTSEHMAHEAAAKAAITSSNGVTFTKEQSWKVDFATDLVRQEPFGQVIRTTAQIQPSLGDERIITAKTSGTAIFNDNIVVGKGVAAGQALFTIDGGATADNNLTVRYAEAESEYNRAKAEYERKTELAKESIVSQSDLLSAKAEYISAEANYNHLKNNFPEGRQTVSSPINGFVTSVLVGNGQFVEAGLPVMVVSQNRNLFLKAELQPKYFDILGSITSANVRILNTNQTCSLEELGGRLLSYGKSTDLNNPLIPIVFQIDNAGISQQTSLLPGSIVELYIKTLTNTHAITIPNGAIIEEMGNYFVFVQCTPELFEKRPVKTGVTDGLRIEIKEGLEVGDRVVSKGAILVKLAQASGALDPHAGHVH